MIDTTSLDLKQLLAKEMLETNGLGGYASMSIAGANTRKYHGLLIAADNPPTERKVKVAKVEERLKVGEEFIDLTVNQFPGTMHPRGDRYLKSFERRPLATWNYAGENWALQKKIFMVQGSATTVVQYKNLGKENLKMELHSLFADKDYHSDFHQNDFDYAYEKLESGMKINSHAGSEPLFFSWSKGSLQEARAWYKNIVLYREVYRETGHTEDYYRIGFLDVELEPGEEIYLLFSTEEKMTKAKPTELLQKAIEHYESLKDKNIDDKFYHDLLASGDQFLVHRASTDSKTIIAGYHWFTDWGRDTMIAMRGLTIATGKQAASKSILSTFFKYLDKGMLPNNFPDYAGQEIEYNTIDATLWLFVAMYDYYQKFEDKAFVKKNLPHLGEIIQKHIEGTRYNIKLTDEGFIYGGEEGWQLTWMDARVDGYVVTPRRGCPVEITALWYNALKIYEFFTDELKQKKQVDVAPILEKIDKNFKKRYLRKDGSLNDVVQPMEGEDSDFRSNQIYAVSLPFGLLSEAESAKIVELVGKYLVTPYGLRSLHPDHADFKPVYGGSRWSRDVAYHQGTVWSYVIGEYAEAYLKVNEGSAKAKKEVKELLDPLKKHFEGEDCIHGISEVFDGERPKAGRGCINQAWSVAALIKLYADYGLSEIV